MVLDVGTGSGILAVWAAQAGARKVYAVEVRRLLRLAALCMCLRCVALARLYQGHCPPASI